MGRHIYDEIPLIILPGLTCFSTKNRQRLMGRDAGLK
jgi:hypothetical protein